MCAAFIIILFCKLVKTDGKNTITWILAAVNAAIYLTAAFSHLPFYIDETNHFHGGFWYFGKTVSVKISGKANSVNNVYTNTNYAKIRSKNTATTLTVKGFKKGLTTLKIKVNGVVLKLRVSVK